MILGVDDSPFVHLVRETILINLSAKGSSSSSWRKYKGPIAYQQMVIDMSQFLSESLSTSTYQAIRQAFYQMTYHVTFEGFPIREPMSLPRDQPSESSKPLESARRISMGGGSYESSSQLARSERQ